MRRRRLTGFTCGLAASLISGGLSAQGRVRGLAYDSLLGRPLAGATVWLRDLNRSAFTDSSGRFTLDSVPDGRHLFLLAHPDLDSAGLGTVAAAVTVARGQDVALAVPSIRTLWRRLCGRDSIGADSAIVFGSVRDADSHVPLSGVAVTVVWPRIHVGDSLHVRVETLADSATTDSTGAYRVCGVATGLNVRAQARTGPVMTGIVQLMASERPVARRDFSLSLVLQIADSGRGSSGLRGRVRSEAGRPVGGAVAVLEGVDSTVSDGEGRFALSRLPGGTQWLRARAVGFSPLEAAVDLPGSGVKTLDLELRTITVVDTITVVASGRMAQEMAQVDQRRRMGFGYALKEEEIRRRPSIRSVFQGIPSVVVSGSGGGDWVIFMRSHNMTGGGLEGGPGGRLVAVPSYYCVPSVFIDGIEEDVGQLRSYTAEELVAVEVFTQKSLAPARYQTLHALGCGVVLVWTKHLN